MRGLTLTRHDASSKAITDVWFNIPDAPHYGLLWNRERDALNGSKAHYFAWRLSIYGGCEGTLLALRDTAGQIASVWQRQASGTWLRYDAPFVGPLQHFSRLPRPRAA